MTAPRKLRSAGLLLNIHESIDESHFIHRGWAAGRQQQQRLAARGSRSPAGGIERACVVCTAWLFSVRL